MKHHQCQSHEGSVTRRSTPLARLQAISLIGIIALTISACATPHGTSARIPTQMLALEAEDADITNGALTVRDEPSASQGRALVPSAEAGTASADVEAAAISFEITTAGQYVLWARLKGASLDQSAMNLGFDGALERIDLFSYGDYFWVAASVAELTPGVHRVSISNAEPETSLDAVVVSSRRDLTSAQLDNFLIRGEMPPEVPAESPSEGPDSDPSSPAAPKPSGPERAIFDLRGDPDFDPANLPADAQVWYRRMWKSIDDSVYDVYEWAASDDLYKYARDLQTHVQFLLHAFRLTGDLKLLDEVDYILEIMRDQLHDSWRDVLEGSTAPGKDGYRNWVWRFSSGDSYVGKDTNKLDEMKTHALVASVAHALNLNRDLESPGGVNYGAHADFWLDYLINDFEAKWRERENSPHGFPIMIRAEFHTYYSWTKYHYYMSFLTGNQGYMKEAERMAEVLWNEVVVADTKTGPAYLWRHAVLGEGGKTKYLHSTVYARYVYQDSIEFFMEGFGWWSEEDLAAMARTFTTWVIDVENANGSRDWFESDIGGGQERAGVPSDPKWNRMDYYRYEASAYAEIAPWDETGQMDAMTDRVLDKTSSASSPRYLALPMAKLLTAFLN